MATTTVISTSPVLNLPIHYCIQAYIRPYGKMQVRPKITVTSDGHLSPEPRRKGKSPSPSPTERLDPGTKKRAMRRENWEIHRATIKRLYIDEGKKLNDIVEIMRRDYDFTANARMYKHRLSQWGLIKYNREADVQRILQLKNQRDAEGKDSHIEINGRVVDFDRVQRYLQRRKISVDEFAEESFARSRRGSKGSKSPAEDEDDEVQELDVSSASITIRTPISSPISPALPLSPSARSPASPGVAEEVIWDASACASEVVKDPSVAELPPSPLGFALIDSVVMIAELMEQHSPGPAGEYMQLASKQAEDVIRSHPHEAIVCLYEATLVLARPAPEVAALILRHAAEVSAIFMPEAHPMPHLLRKLAEVADEAVAGAAKDVHMLVETTRRAFHRHITTWERALGHAPGGSLTWWCWVRYLRSVGPDDAAADLWVSRSEEIMRTAVDPRDRGRPMEDGSFSGLEAGIPMEKLVLLGRYEICTALSPTVYSRLERYIVAHIRRCCDLQALSTQALHEFFMASIARQAGRLVEADEYSRASVSSYMAAGNIDYAMRVMAWMSRWAGQDFDSDT
ncbi:hypothetical protein RB594_006959 [Gaeumannomyces avenae]